ncbi:MAG: T9SS type A sorting domain-containing protein, partial [Bacteroidota bacterium]|nr:T9SS type A sorting domain-containing protein [Bacteroidota bacterium]
IAGLSIDTSRIFVTGMSNGGFMAYRIACELSHRIAAIAPVAATMSFDCLPVNPVSIIHFHSYLDENIPYDGGIGNGVSDHYNPPLDSVFDVWAGFNSCSVFADTVYNGTDYAKIGWTGCNCNSEIIYYITHDGGHSWPGGSSTIFGDSVSQYISASNLMWDFFVQHPLCFATSIDQTENHSSEIKIYPNPTTGLVNISTNISNIIKSISVYDIMGETVFFQKISRRENIKIDFEHLVSGIYFIRIITDDCIVTKRIVINKKYSNKLK